MPSNKPRSYTILFAYKEDGNRNLGTAEKATVEATTVQRAIAKLVRELNTPEDDKVDAEGFEQAPIKASELLVIDVRTAEVTKFLNSHG